MIPKNFWPKSQWGQWSLFYKETSRCIYICIYGGFLKWGGTPSHHPFIDGFSLINNPFWGTPICGNPHINIQGKMERLLAPSSNPQHPAAKIISIHVQLKQGTSSISTCLSLSQQNPSAITVIWYRSGGRTRAVHGFPLGIPPKLHNLPLKDGSGTLHNSQSCASAFSFLQTYLEVPSPICLQSAFPRHQHQA
jgi:hypothetical protein